MTKKTMSWDLRGHTHMGSADQSWNVTLTSWVQQEGGKYSWHTNRKWLEPPHNGVSCTPPPPTTPSPPSIHPPHDSSLLAYSPLSLIFHKCFALILFSHVTPLLHPHLFIPLLIFLTPHPHQLPSRHTPYPRRELSQKLEWKQEVINQWSVPFKNKDSVEVCAFPLLRSHAKPNILYVRERPWGKNNHQQEPGSRWMLSFPWWSM